MCTVWLLRYSAKSNSTSHFFFLFFRFFVFSVVGMYGKASTEAGSYRFLLPPICFRDIGFSLVLFKVAEYFRISAINSLHDSLEETPGLPVGRRGGVSFWRKSRSSGVLTKDSISRTCVRKILVRRWS